MDWLRSCYESDWNLPGIGSIRGRFFKADPSSPPMPDWSYYGSRNWHKGDGSDWPEFGETENATQRWTNCMPFLPPNYIDGLAVSIPTVPPAGLMLRVQPGKATSTLQQLELKITSAFDKRLDLPWAAGSGNGGLLGSALVAGTWAKAYLIRSTVTGAADVGVQVYGSGPTLPSGYDDYREIMSLQVLAGPAIRPMVMFGDWVYWMTQLADYYAVNPGIGPNYPAMPSPPGKRSELLLAVNLWSPTTASRIHIFPPDAGAWAAAFMAPPLVSITPSSIPYDSCGQVRTWCDAAGLIGFSLAISDANTQLLICELAYRDTRGRVE